MGGSRQYRLTLAPDVLLRSRCQRAAWIRRLEGGLAMRYAIREKFIHLGEDSDITDESGNAVFHVDGKVFTIHDRLVVRDMRGEEVANIHRRLIALRPTYEIERQGQET